MVNRVNRAKLFIPFDALKGLQEALREKEKEIEERKELSEESLEKLEENFNNIEISSQVTIRFYKNKQYINVSGIVTDIDYVKKKIVLDKDIKININDIIKIEF